MQRQLTLLMAAMGMAEGEDIQRQVSLSDWSAAMHNRRLISSGRDQGESPS